MRNSALQEILVENVLFTNLKHLFIRGVVKVRNACSKLEEDTAEREYIALKDVRDFKHISDLLTLVLREFVLHFEGTVHLCQTCVPHSFEHVGIYEARGSNYCVH